MKILLVEDNKDVRETYVDFFTHNLGAEVTAHDNVKDARIALSFGNKFDLIVTDYDLGPGENGVDLIKGIRGARWDVPIILASGNKKKDLEAQVDGLERVYVVTKGVDDFEEFERIAKAI